MIPSASTALPPAILLMGPTASGKTALAMQLAERHPLALVSVDSAQVFIDMDAGTAKPSADELARHPHRLINLITPEESYSAARFRHDALAAMDEIRQAGRVPLLVGGTMLYFRALLQGLADLPQADPAVRAELDADAARLGWPALHARLRDVDPLTADRLHPGDSQRIQRALEIYQLSGQAMSSLLRASEPAGQTHDFLQIGLLPSERGVLHARIAQRFDGMLLAGLDEEVRHLRQKYRLHPDLPSMRCVGYRQTWEAQEGLIARKELRERGIYATRQLAKRQITWLGNSFKAENHDCLAPDLAQKTGDRIAAWLETRHF